MRKFKRWWRSQRVRWKWRHYRKSDWPYRYVGPTVPNWQLEHGIPLQDTAHQKSGHKGRTYLDANGIIRLLPGREQVKKR